MSVTRHWTGSVRFALPLLAVVAWCFAALTAYSAPTLEAPPGSEPKSAYLTSDTASIKLRYTDANGDPIKKADAIFTDESASGTVSHTASDVDGKDTTKGVTITWTINGFAAGSHRGHFEVTAPTMEVARYPAEPSTYYSFGVEAPWVRWAELFGGIAVCIGFLPFITYLVVRSLNPRSDPGRAARGALFIGILGACALFIYLFAGIGAVGLPLLIGICVIGVIVGLFLFLGRR